MINPIYRRLSFLIFLIALICSNGSLYGQESKDSTTLYYVETRDGNIYQGELLSKSRRRIEVRTEYLGVISIETSYLAHLEPYDSTSIINGVYWVKNKIPGRYALLPTGLLQDGGKGYYENRMLLINHFNFALSDRISLGLGTIPFVLFTSDASTPIWLVPKIKLTGKNKDFSLSTGVFFSRTFFSEYDFDEASMTMPFLVGSYGKSDISFSVGMGYGSFDREWMSSPAYSFSGSIRVGRRSFIFFENIMVNTFNREPYQDRFLLFSIGGRVIRKGKVWDFGLFTPQIYDDDPLRVIPYGSFFIPFKNRKNGRR